MNAEDAELVWDQLRLQARGAVDFVRRFAITYPDNPARQALLDRLNLRWRDREEPPPPAGYFRAHL